MREYSLTLKREAVQIYLETGDYDMTAGEIERKFGEKVSLRSIQYWVKNPLFRTSKDENGNLILFHETNIQINGAQLRKQIIDKEKFLEVYGKLFAEEGKELTRIQKIILKTFKGEEVEKEVKSLGIFDRAKLYALYQKIKREDFEFVLDAVGRTDDEGVETLGQLMDQIEGAIPDTAGEKENGGKSV